MIDDGTGLREAAARLENSQQQCDDSGEMISVSRRALDETLAAIEALSAVAPPPVLEGCAPGWGIAGNYGDGKWRCFREGASQTYLGYPKTTANEAIAETHRLAMLAASPAAPAQPEGGAFEQWWERVGDEYYSGGMTGLDIAEAAWKAAAAQPEGGDGSLRGHLEDIKASIEAGDYDLARYQCAEAMDGFNEIGTTRPAPAQQAVTDGVEVVRIDRSERLDPITVYLADEGGGRGRMTIVCYNQAWTCYWGAMGNRTLREFVARCDASYVSGNMLSGLVSEASDFAYAERVAEAVIAALTSTAAKAAEGVDDA